MNTVVLVLSLDSIIIVVIISSIDDKMEAIIIPSNLVPHHLSYINTFVHTWKISCHLYTLYWKNTLP